MTLEDCHTAKENKTPVTIEYNWKFADTPTFITKVISDGGVCTVQVDCGEGYYEIERVRLYEGKHSAAGTWFTYPEHRDLLKPGVRYVVFQQNSKKKYFEYYTGKKCSEYDDLITHFCKVNDPD